MTGYAPASQINGVDLAALRSLRSSVRFASGPVVLDPAKTRIDLFIRSARSATYYPSARFARSVAKLDRAADSQLEPSLILALRAREEHRRASPSFSSFLTFFPVAFIRPAVQTEARR